MTNPLNRLATVSSEAKFPSFNPKLCHHGFFGAFPYPPYPSFTS